MVNNYPYTNLYNLNLDWILAELKKISDVVSTLDPQNLVQSVNGKQGVVTLNAGDVGAIDAKQTLVQLSAIADATWNIHRLAAGISSGIQFKNDAPYAEIIHGTNRWGVYSEGNPPPYPVLSFNDREGDIDLEADDVKELLINNVAVGDAGTTIEDYTQQELQELYEDGKRVLLHKRIDDVNYTTVFFLRRDDDGTVTPEIYDPSELSGAVTSVNGKSGAVVLSAGDIGALPSTTTLATLGGVPSTRTINGKPLSSNVTLTATDIGLVPAENIRIGFTLSTAGVISEIQSYKYNPFSDIKSDMIIANCVVTPAIALKQDLAFETSDGDITLTQGALTEQATIELILISKKE